MFVFNQCFKLIFVIEVQNTESASELSKGQRFDLAS